MKERSWGFRTRAVHAGAVPDAATGGISMDRVYVTVQKYGNMYGRLA